MGTRVRPMREFRSLRWLGLAVLVCGSGAAGAQPTVPVTVVVKDVTGAAIWTAAVQVSLPGNLPTRMKADAGGRIALALKEGQYELRILAPGFQAMNETLAVAGPMTVPVVLKVGTVSGPVEVIADAAPFQTEAAPVMAMIQNASAPAAGYTPVTVVVTDASGAVVPGAEIRVTPGSPAGDRLITDEQGRAQLGMPAGHYQIEVTAQGFSPNKGALIVVDKPQTLTVTLTAVPSSSGVPVSAGPAPMQPGAVPLETTREMPHAEGASAPAAATANTLVIVGTGGLRGVFTLATLMQYPQTTVTIHDHHTNADETFSGVPLIDLLAKLGVPHGADLKGKALGTYVVATGSDGYKSVVALGELDPEFHPGVVLIADTMDGKPLDKAGPFRLVVTEDKRPARSVRNLVKVEVRTAE
jgi:Carboxypeptidase regulatory-like domain/Oxidoreductase molybdopterin binding domain